MPDADVTRERKDDVATALVHGHDGSLDGLGSKTVDGHEQEEAEAPSRSSRRSTGSKRDPTPRRVQLRDYQRRLVEKIQAAYRDGNRRVLFTLPTGAGKTLVAVEAVAAHLDDVGGQVLWVAPRDLLLHQAAKELRRQHPGLRHAWFTGSRKSGAEELETADVVFRGAAVRKRIRDHAPGVGFTLLVIDEAHHTGARGYVDLRRRLHRENPGLLGLGMTATPERTDRRRLDYDATVLGPSYVELMRVGHLARPTIESPSDHPITVIETGFSWRPGFTRDKRLSRRALARLSNRQRNKRIVEHYKHHRDRFGKTLVFAGTANHASDLALEFCIAGVAAAWVDYTTEPEIREDVLESFQHGDLDVVVNQRVFIEGLDVPGVRTVFVTAPTQSPILYMQMVGRGSRPIGENDTFYIVDVQDNFKDFRGRFVNQFDLACLGDHMDDADERVYARVRLDGSEGSGHEKDGGGGRGSEGRVVKQAPDLPGRLPRGQRQRQ